MQHGRKKDKITRENICLVLYTKEFEKEEIWSLFYKKRNTRVNYYVDELIKKDWVKETQTQFGIKRFHYCSTTSKCFIDVIKNALKQNNKSLIDNEEERLKKYLESFSFKKWYNVLFLPLFTNRKGQFPINGFSTFLEMLSFRFLIFEHYTDLNLTKKELMEILNKLKNELLSNSDPAKKETPSSGIIPEYEILGLELIKKLKYIVPEVKVDFYEGLILGIMSVTKESMK